MSLQSVRGAIKSSRLQLTALALTLVYLIWTVGSGLAFQGSERVINQHKHAANEPLKLVSVTINNEPRVLNKSFTSNGEWLRGTKLGLRNDSNKDIIYIDFRLNFPQTLSSGNEMSFPLELGNMPGLPVYRDPLLLHPGDEITLALTDKDYEGLTKFIETRQKLSSLTHLQLELAFVVFADETAWQRGIPMKRHPTKPRAWTTANP